MKRILEIDGEMEKVLHAILDAALKAGGMGMLGLVNQLISKVKETES